MTDTSIEWTDMTWNPVAGCTVLSPGCTNCYAMRMAARLEAMGIAEISWAHQDSPAVAPNGPGLCVLIQPRSTYPAALEEAAHGVRQFHVGPLP